MNPHLVASLFWSLLALSIILTFAGVLLESWRVVLLATLCSLIFAIAALASVGVFILMLTSLQLLLAGVFYRKGHVTAIQ